MTDQELLQEYQDILVKMNYEGHDYYIMDYASYETFDFDPELQQLFGAARDGLSRFVDYLYHSIESLGGDPEDCDV